MISPGLKRGVLALEAMMLIGPVTICLTIATIVLVVLVVGGLVTPPYTLDKFKGGFAWPLFVTDIAGVYAMVILWKLVLRTIRHRRFHFGRWFYLGCASGAVAAIGVGYIFDETAVYIAVIPPLIIAAQFIFLQRKYCPSDTEK